MPSSSLAIFPEELISAVARDAAWDAESLIAFLRAVEDRSEETWVRPVRFPAAFLLGAGAALRLASWESVELHPHRTAGLPCAKEVFRLVADWCLQLPTEECDQRVRQLCVTVLEISVTQLAWRGPEVLGANIWLEDIDDEDALLDAIAEIAWKNRHKEQSDDAQ